MKEIVFVEAAGTNTYTASPSPTVDELKRNVIVVAKFANGNTGASTLSLNGGLAIPILRDGAAVVSGDISSSRHYLLAYDGIVFHIVGTSSASSSGGSAQLAIFRRVTSNQTTISGGFAEDYLDYNGEILNEGSHWTKSGEEYTCNTTGLYVFEIDSFDVSSAYLAIEVNGAKSTPWWLQGAQYSTRSSTLKISAGDVVKFLASAGTAFDLDFDDGGAEFSSANQVKIVKLG